MLQKDNSFKLIGFVVWGLCAIFFLYEFFLRTVVGTFQSPIMADFQLSSFKFSFLSSTIFMIGYGFMQIPISMIVGRIGLKKSVMIGAVSCGFAAFAFAYSPNYYAALAVRLFMGIGAGFGFICLLVSVYDWMPNKYSGSFIGLSQFIGTMGPMLAAGPVEGLSHSEGFHWRTAFIVLGIFGLCLSVLIFLFVKNNQRQVSKFIILKPKAPTFIETIKSFVRPEMWKIAFFSALIYFTIEYLSENEGKTFLVEKGLTSSFASYLLTLSWVGYAIGCPLTGYISDKISRRRIIMIIAAFFYLAAIVMFVFSTHQYILIAAFFMLGLGASGQSLGFATMAEQMKKENIAFGLGLNNATITIMMALNAPLIGYIIDVLKDGPFPNQATYMKAFSILIAIGVGTVILALRIKETFCKSKAEYTYINPKYQSENE